MTHATCLINSQPAQNSENIRNSCFPENLSELPGRTCQQSVEARYAPLRVFRLQFKRNQRWLEILLPLLLLLLFVSTFAVSKWLSSLVGEPGVLPALASFFVPPIVVLLCCLRFRTEWVAFTGQVTIDARGLSLPVCGEGEDRSVLIPWHDLVLLDCLRASEPSEELVFRFNSSGWDRQTKQLARHWGGSKVRLLLQAFPESERQRILSALSRFAPCGRISHSLLERTSFNCEATYTSIWLEALGAAPRRFASSALEPGTFLYRYRYEVVKQMASGGQATTYEAIDHEAAVDKGEPWHVVLKEFIVPVHADENAVQEMFAEVGSVAQILNSVACPSIVRLVGRFVEDFRAYLVLEFVEGETVRELVHSRLSNGTGPLESSAVVQLGIQMARIIARLHDGAKPVIHRDFTPDNLILTPDGTLKLIDFDVAVSEDQCRTATVVGKPSYLAPEPFKQTPQLFSQRYT